MMSLNCTCIHLQYRADELLLVSSEMPSRLKTHIYLVFYEFNVTSMTGDVTFSDTTLLNNYHYWTFNRCVCMYECVYLLLGGWVHTMSFCWHLSLCLTPFLFPLWASFILYLPVSGRPEECLMQQGLCCCSPAAVLRKQKKERKRESSRLDHRNVNTSGAKITQLS